MFFSPHKFVRTFSTAFLLICAGTSVYAGGNLIQQDPANPGDVIERKWDDRLFPIKWELSSDGDPGSGISNATITAEFTAAFDTWEALATSRLDFAYSGEVNRRSSGLDGHNIVTFTDPDVVFPPGVVGLATTFTFTTPYTVDASNSDLDGDGTPDLPEGVYPPGAILDGDIMFNSSLPYETSGVNGTLDIRSIALHEVGHFFGLSHSSIDDAIMFPFLSNDIALARIPKNDDIAYASYFYPQEPAFSSTFGTITGRITNGIDGVRVLGAHVYAVDTTTGEKIVGAYSLLDGSYTIPIAAGNYFVAIEPLDGDPPALDPKRINEVIAYTFDTSFSEEFYDANESNVEADPMAALPVAVAAGTPTPNIDIVTNTLEVPGIGLVISPGINYLTYPVAVPTGLTSFDLLTAMGTDTEINAIESYNSSTGLFERANFEGGVASGINFDITREKGFIVYSQVQKAVSFVGTPDCPDLNLNVGLNIIAVPCPPATYSAYDLLKNLGNEFEVTSVQRYDKDSGSFEVAQYVGGVPSGADFPVVNGEAYIAEMTVNKFNVKVPGQGQIFPPSITGISPGRGVPDSIVTIIGQGFDTVFTNNLVLFNGVVAPVLFATPTVLTVKVPLTASTGMVTVEVDSKISNGANFIVENATISENPNGDTEIISGQTAQGDISVEGEQDRYTFIALAGTKATISAKAVTPGTPDMMLMLEGPSGGLLYTDDDGGIGTDALINNFTITETGVHTIVVTSVPGTGSGPYTLSLNISNITTAPAISILSGDSQSALPGTDLPFPLEVLVTSSSGQPLAGVPVTFTATDVTLGPSSSGLLINAGTTAVSTNGNGIATAQATLPAATNAQYNIVVTVPGFPAQTLTVGSIDTAVAEVVITGNNQDCGGEGCEVDTDLPSQYSVQFKDVSGNNINNVFTQWKVVSGGGSLSNFSPSESPVGSGKQTTGADGLAKVTHKLGKQVFFPDTKIRIPQTVAVTIPGQLKPVLFGAKAKAGLPSKFRSAKTNFSKLTYNTARLNAIYVIVTDQFDNPVKGAVISPSTAGGLTINPGLLDGAYLPNFETNDDGVWVGMVGAGGVAPTIDEFGGSRASAYSISVAVSGVSPLAPISFNVDVGMGPDMVTWSTQGDSALITKDLTNPVQKRLFRYQRVDTYSPTDGDDADAGDWRDESFNPTNLRLIPLGGVPVKFTVRREDGETEVSPIQPTKINGSDTVTIPTDVNGIAEVNVKMSDVGGVINIIGEISGGVNVTFTNDNFHPGQDGAALHDPAQVPNPQTFTDENNFAESTTLNAIPVVLTIKVDDKHGLSSDQVSGVDLQTLGINLIGATTKTLFDGATNPALPLGKFPNFTRIFLDGAEQSVWPGADLIGVGGIGELQLIYQPSGNELSAGTNKVRITGGLKDKAENEASSTDVDLPFNF